MHISNTRLGSPLTELEQAHLAQCQDCQFEHNMLIELSRTAESSTLIEPPPAVWAKIQSSRQQKVVNKPRLWPTISALAASTVFVAFSWLMFNNYQLQNQLEQVLQVNQTLELQLMQDSMPTFRQAQLLTRVRKIEQQLLLATTAEEKLLLLKKRQGLIADMVNSQQGEQHEFSI